MQQGAYVAVTDWRAALRRKIGWLLAAKLAALLVLWMLFFSPAHRVEVTKEAAGRHLALDGAEQTPGEGQ
jgi:hypothetical protein